MLVPTIIWGWKTTLVRWMNVNSWDNEVPRWLLYSISPGYSRVQIGSFILLMMAIYHQTEDKWRPEVSESEILDVRHSSSGEVLLFIIWCEKCFSDLWRSKLYIWGTLFRITFHIQPVTHTPHSGFQRNGQIYFYLGCALRYLHIRAEADTAQLFLLFWM